MQQKPFNRHQVSTTFNFKIPKGYESKRKLSQNINRHLWCTPDTLFVLCELKLRNYLAPSNYNYFWPKVMLLLHKTTDKINLSQYLLINNNKNNYQLHWDKLTNELKHLHIINDKILCTRINTIIKDDLMKLRETNMITNKASRNHISWGKTIQLCEIQINDQFFDLNEHN